MYSLPLEIAKKIRDDYLNYATSYMLSLTCKRLCILPLVGRMQEFVDSIQNTSYDGENFDQATCSHKLQPPTVLDEIVLDCSLSQFNYVFENMLDKFTKTTCLSAMLAGNKKILQEIYEAWMSQTPFALTEQENNYLWSFLFAKYAAGAGKIDSLTWIHKNIVISDKHNVLDFAFALDVPESVKFYCECYKIDDIFSSFSEQILGFDAVECFKVAEAYEREKESYTKTVASLIEIYCSEETFPNILTYIDLSIDDSDAAEIREEAEVAELDLTLEWLDGRCSSSSKDES